MNHNPFKKYNKTHNQSNKPDEYKKSFKNGLNINDTILFPKLTEHTNNSTTTSTTNFKDILNNIIIEETTKINPIKPGWIQLSSINQKTHIEYGDKYDEEDGDKEDEEKNKNNKEEDAVLMFKAIETMKQKWDLYKQEYDSINGEGTYTSKFCLSPVYGSEYDTESQDETEEEEEE